MNIQSKIKKRVTFKMINPKNLRIDYLNAMGIDIWLPRNTSESNNSQINISPKKDFKLGGFDSYVYEDIDNKEIKWLVIGNPCSVDADILLDKMMFAVGLKRISKANLILNDIDYLYDQIESISPKIMLLLGNEVTIKIYKKNESFEQMRGKVHQFEETKLIVTEHPDILLKNPLQKRGVWHDLSMSSSILSEDQR